MRPEVDNRFLQRRLQIVEKEEPKNYRSKFGKYFLAAAAVVGAFYIGRYSAAEEDRTEQNLRGEHARAVERSHSYADEIVHLDVSDPLYANKYRRLKHNHDAEEKDAEHIERMIAILSNRKLFNNNH